MIKNKTIHNNLSDIISDTKEYKELFVLFGNLNQIIINSSISIIEAKLIDLGYSKSLVSRSKFICIELLENIFKHQFKNKTTTPYFGLSFCDDEMKITAGNSISKDNLDTLQLTLDKYKNLSQEDVTKAYMDKLRVAELDENGNAGLGLLSIFKRAARKFDYKIETLKSDEYYLNSTVRVPILS